MQCCDPRWLSVLALLTHRSITYNEPKYSIRQSIHTRNLFSARSWVQWYLVCSGFPKVKACDGSLATVNHYYGRVERNDRASEKFKAVLEWLRRNIGLWVIRPGGTCVYVCVCWCMRLIVAGCLVKEQRVRWCDVIAYDLLHLKKMSLLDFANWHICSFWIFI